MADQDDAIREEDEQQEEGGGGQGRRQRGQGGGKGNGKQPRIDLLSDEQSQRVWGFLRSFVAMQANDAGRWAGQTGLGEKALQALDSLVGKGVAGTFVFPAIATYLNEPKVLKDAIRKAGLPPQLNHVLDDGIDDLIEGFRQAHRDRGQLSPEDAARIASGAHKASAGRLSQAFTYPQSLGCLWPADQAKFQVRLAGLGEDRRKEFDEYKARISHPRDLHVLLLLPDDQWIPHLKQKYGDINPPAAKGIVSTVESMFEAVDKVAKRIFEPPATGPDPIVEAIKKARASAKKRKFHV